MDEEIKNEALDEAALDAELQESIAAVQAGKTLVENKQELDDQEIPETKVKEDGLIGKPSEVDDKPQPVDTDKKTEFRIPNKGPNESDESYEKRVELFDLVQRRKAATSDEARQALAHQISETKSELKSLGESDKNYKQTEKTVISDEDEDPILKADKERLKALGGATRDEVQQIIREERLNSEIKSNIQSFVDRHEALKDPVVRDVFFEFVDENYSWEGKVGKDLMTVLEMAHEYMFKPSETMQQRVLKSANVQEKVNAMQFPGVSGNSKSDYSPEMQKSIEELKSVGYSEEKALELLSD